jgi:hypothetical protein
MATALEQLTVNGARKIRPYGVRNVYQAAPEKCATGRHRWHMERAPAGALSMCGAGLGGLRR